jgi:hypothetical protein
MFKTIFQRCAVSEGAKAYRPQYVELLSDARTKLGKKRVLRRLG